MTPVTGLRMNMYTTSTFNDCKFKFKYLMDEKLLISLFICFVDHIYLFRIKHPTRGWTKEHKSHDCKRGGCGFDFHSRE